MHTFAKALLFLILFLVFLRITPAAFAATLTSSSDTLSTSRPSPSTPLNGNAAASSASISIFDNGSTFLSSDSARLFGPVDTTETVTVATVSAAKTTLFFTSNTANAHTAGTVVAAPITAMHTVKFTTQTNIPSTGSIVIQFPASASVDTDQASPSARTFMPNGLASANIKTNQANLTCSLNSFSAGNSPTVTCNNATSAISGGTVILIFIGCSATTGSGATMTCSTQVPTFINPTKSALSGTADTWSVSVNTWSGASGTGTGLDNVVAKVGTVESVNVVAHIDPTFSFVISGVANGTALNTGGTCGASHATDTSNSGFDTTSTDVNLGTLLSTQVNRAHQKMVIASNAISGYTITATASGHLINPANGYFLQDAQTTATANDTPVPTTLATGSEKFGIHPCDANSKVNTATWGQATPDFANPSASFYYTLVNSSGAPSNSGDTIYVEYAASPAGNTPPGDYHTALTYVATAIF